MVMQSTRWSTAWFLVASALCCQCAKESVFDPATRSDGGDSDLAQPLELGTPRDAGINGPRDLATGGTADLAMLPPVSDMASTDMAGFIAGSYYQVSSKLTGQLLSLHGSATAAGTTTEQQPAHGGPDQRWTLATTNGGYQIINGGSQSCLDVNGASTANGATTSIQPCGTATSQVWTLKDAGSGNFNLVNLNSGSCLDLSGGSSSPGAVISQYQCNGGDNQKWFFTRVP
jgi:hypothetical protein